MFTQYYIVSKVLPLYFACGANHKPLDKLINLVKLKRCKVRLFKLNLSFTACTKTQFSL